MCESGQNNSPIPFVLKCLLLQQHGPSLEAPSFASFIGFTLNLRMKKNSGHLCRWFKLKNFLRDEEIKKFAIIRIVSRTFRAPMDVPSAKKLSEATLYMECFPPNECFHKHFEDCLLIRNSDWIPLSESTAAAKVLHDILEILESWCLQSTNKTGKENSVPWGWKITPAMLQHGFYTLMPDKTNLFN